MAKRLSLFNLLIKERKWVLLVWLLLIEWGHSKLLVHEGLVFTSRWSVAIVGVVAEGRVVEVAKMGHNCVDSTQESFILLDHVELVSAAS